MAKKPEKVDPFKQAKYEVENALNRKRNYSPVDAKTSRELDKALKKGGKTELRKALRKLNLIPEIMELELLKRDPKFLRLLKKAWDQVRKGKVHDFEKVMRETAVQHLEKKDKNKKPTK